MKKYLIFTVCTLFVCLIPFTLYAENNTANTFTETELHSTAITAPEKTSSEMENPESESNLLSVRFEQWVLPHLEEIAVVVTLIFSLFFQMRKHKLLSKAIGTMNNNAIAIAESNSDMMSKALLNMENTSGAVTAYDDRIAALLDAFRSTAEDKERLEQELAEIKHCLKTATEANIEFSNELAELLNLANIPNFKKEEIGSRHRDAIRALRSGESVSLTVAQNAEEVQGHGGEKT